MGNDGRRTHFETEPFGRAAVSEQRAVLRYRAVSRQRAGSKPNLVAYRTYWRHKLPCVMPLLVRDERFFFRETPVNLEFCQPDFSAGESVNQCQEGREFCFSVGFTSPARTETTLEACGESTEYADAIPDCIA